MKTKVKWFTKDNQLKWYMKNEKIFFIGTVVVIVQLLASIFQKSMIFFFIVKISMSRTFYKPFQNKIFKLSIHAFLVTRILYHKKTKAQSIIL